MRGGSSQSRKKRGKDGGSLENEQRKRVSDGKDEAKRLTGFEVCGTQDTLSTLRGKDNRHLHLTVLVVLGLKVIRSVV